MGMIAFSSVVRHGEGKTEVQSLTGNQGHCPNIKFRILPFENRRENARDCLEANEKAGAAYHREGINGDYDDFKDVEKLIEFIRTGCRT